MHPLNSSSSSSRGMAVISLDLRSVFTCPKVRVLAEPQALTRWMACLPALLSWERRTVWPSMATTSPGSRSATPWLHSMKHSWNRSGIQAGEHVAEGVTGRDALGQIQKGAEPFLLALAEKLHLDPGVRAADDGANGDGDVVQQLVPLAPLNPRVLQFSKTLHDGRSPPFPHHSPIIPWSPIQRQAYHL